MEQRNTASAAIVCEKQALGYENSGPATLSGAARVCVCEGGRGVGSGARGKWRLKGKERTGDGEDGEETMES